MYNALNLYLDNLMDSVFATFGKRKFACHALCTGGRLCAKCAT